MPIFGDPSSPYDESVEKVTAETMTNENWTLMFDICDRVTAEGPRAYKQCLLSVKKRLNHRDPHVVLLALSLLDCLWNNCGAQFRREVSSKDFVGELNYKCTNVSSRTNTTKSGPSRGTKSGSKGTKGKEPKKYSKSNRVIAEKTRFMIKKWVENECKKDSSLSLIESLYKDLLNEGYSFEPDPTAQKKKTVVSNDPNVVSSEQEEADIAKAIALSLQESGKKQSAQNSYPTLNNSSTSQNVASHSNQQQKIVKKVKALYDFEAAEDNELSFLAGELINVHDDSDQNWWRGSTERGTNGLFPASFVTTDITEPEIDPRNVEKAEPAVPKVQIDESILLRCIQALENCDPAADPSTDPPELPILEQMSKAQAPLIDQKLVQIDKQLNMLAEVDLAIREVLTAYDTAVQQVAIPSSITPALAPVHSVPMSSYAASTSTHQAPISSTALHQPDPGATTVAADPASTPQYYQQPMNLPSSAQHWNPNQYQIQ